MSTILVPSLISVTTMSLLVAVLYLHLYLANKDRLLKLWSAAWGIYSLRFIVQILMVLHILPPWMVVVQEAATMAGALFCMAGAYNLANRSTNSWWLYGAGAILCWVVLAHILHLPFFWSDLPSSSFTGFLFAWSGVIILRQVQIPGIGRVVSSYALILWGIHRADYTFLRPVEWFAPWGFQLASVFFIAAAVGMLLLYFDKIRAELLKEIQDRILIQKTLAESEDKYRMLFENMTPGVFYQRIDGVLADCNKSALEMLGLTHDQFIGKTSSDPLWKVIKEDGTDLPGDKHPSMVALNKGKSVHDEVVGVFNPHKKDYTWLVVNAIPQFKEGMDKPYQAFVTLHDITERKKMEEQLRQAHKMESIGTLTGGIAHDFNNILGIIVGNTELALDDVPEWNPAYSSLKEIKTASLRATNIVKQLLSFSRKTDQKLQPIEVAIVIKDALKFLRSTIPSTINIHQEIHTTDETILADPTQMNQIIMNLCINASHAMEQTGGDLTVTVEKVILDHKSLKEYSDLKSGSHVKIMVRDTGPGIDPEIIDQIFDPYFTTKAVDKGSGMGLAVVQGIVKNHNGTITVDSILGKGTTFNIFFPLATEKEEIEGQKSQEVAKGSETILFVDDEISITKMVKRMFERLGYKVETATTPQDALDRFRLNPDHFDLVITDMTMPQMTGVTLSEKLMEIRPNIPIIICTGHSALVDEERAKELGLAAYVMKPINMQETAQTIRKVLDRT